MSMALPVFRMQMDELTAPLLREFIAHSGKVAAEDDFVEENEEPLADNPVLEE